MRIIVLGYSGLVPLQFSHFENDQSTLLFLPLLSLDILYFFEGG